MKKTITTAAILCLLMVTGLKAKKQSNSNNLVTTTLVAKIEISSFCKAIVKGDLDTVKKLIELGENVNQKSLGMTPVMYAAKYNKVEILELLIDNGADLNVKSKKGWTAKKYATLSGAKEALAILNDKNNI